MEGVNIRQASHAMTRRLILNMSGTDWAEEIKYLSDFMYPDAERNSIAAKANWQFRTNGFSFIKNKDLKSQKERIENDLRIYL